MADNSRRWLSTPFVTAMLDPSIIPGVYNTCDQWCMYCPITSRCLAYRCGPPESARPAGLYSTPATRMYESLQFVRELNAAEGRRIPEVEAVLTRNDEALKRSLPINDPLEKMARRYAAMASRYLASHPDYAMEIQPRPEGPTALEVFAWYHVLIAARVFRALVCLNGAASGDPVVATDALSSAKTALVGIDRSRAALEVLRQSDDDPRLEDLAGQLVRLVEGVEARFPEARAFQRPGLDAPAPIRSVPES